MRDIRRRAAHLLLLVGLAVLAGCSTMYVDNGTPEVPTSAFKKPAAPQPVQVLFEFQTKGTANARATDALKKRVVEQVQASGIFGAVSEAPAPGGALLGITVNNVPMSDDAFTKGFLTGFTFGLAGSQVSDGYVCTASYTPATGAAPIVKQARHAIHTTIGATSAPTNGTKAANAEEAVTLMLRQVVSRVLHELSQDAAFK